MGVSVCLICVIYSGHEVGIPILATGADGLEFGVPLAAGITCRIVVGGYDDVIALMHDPIDGLLVGYAANADVDCGFVDAVTAVQDIEADGIHGGLADIDVGIRPGSDREIPEAVGAGLAAAVEGTLLVLIAALLVQAPLAFTGCISSTIVAVSASAICIGVRPADLAIVMLRGYEYGIVAILGLVEQVVTDQRIDGRFGNSAC